MTGDVSKQTTRGRFKWQKHITGKNINTTIGI